jgi:hypothetical protein
MSKSFLATDLHGFVRIRQEDARDPISRTYEFWNSGNLRNESTPLCTNLRRDTAPTLATNPTKAANLANRAPWNERVKECI